MLRITLVMLLWMGCDGDLAAPAPGGAAASRDSGDAAPPGSPVVPIRTSAICRPGCLPDCFYQVFVGCVPAGSCTESLTDSPTDRQICYQNGVKDHTVAGPSSQSTNRLYAADGGLCLVSHVMPAADGAVTVVYADAAGAPIATAQTTLQNQRVRTYTCAGSTDAVSVDFTTAACQGCFIDLGACSIGACQAP
jgi:hypothetical protein